MDYRVVPNQSVVSSGLQIKKWTICDRLEVNNVQFVSYLKKAQFVLSWINKPSDVPNLLMETVRTKCAIISFVTYYTIKNEERTESAD